ncbi:fructose-bisphosphate aldolase [Nitzschia inconspicua]|uniref:fructose-bisphosphate aldolase n=1 Tax=Nitzschia inconspicua TaxID=303405 RepID=A0A9K3KSJ1_9STRA|nr:fructose-bisphosphate aldolase [Nitzschia inconspicua]
MTPKANSSRLYIPAGVVTGSNLRRLYEHARVEGYIIPSFKCTSWKTCQLILEAASKNNSPVAIRLYAGSEMGFEMQGEDDPVDCSMNRIIVTALVVRELAQFYQVPVILETETRCLDKLTSWYDKVFQVSEAYCKKRGLRTPLFSAHFLEVHDWEVSDSEDVFLDLVEQYVARLAKSDIWLHIKLPSSETKMEEKLVKAVSRVSRLTAGFTIVTDRHSSSVEALNQVEFTIAPRKRLFRPFFVFDASPGSFSEQEQGETPLFSRCGVIQLQVHEKGNFTEESQPFLKDGLLDDVGLASDTVQATPIADWIKRRQHQKKAFYEAVMKYCGSSNRSEHLTTSEQIPPKNLLQLLPYAFLQAGGILLLIVFSSVTFS